MALRGHRLGTAPTAVDFGARRSETLTLRAVTLDAEATVVLEPEKSAVYVDGQFAGMGKWSGGLPSGTHHFDVLAPGYLPFRRDLRLNPGTKTS